MQNISQNFVLKGLVTTLKDNVINCDRKIYKEIQEN
jgi:hypothetical protein